MEERLKSYPKIPRRLLGRGGLPHRRTMKSMLIKNLIDEQESDNVRARFVYRETF